MIYAIVKALLFRLNAEDAHHITTSFFNKLIAVPFIGGLIKRTFAFEHEKLKTEFCGLTFKNPVGLAAGFDKDGKYIESMSSLGFGFLEIGTVTPKPQVGNPKPRLFRLIEDRAIINRMGFNNEGLDVLVERLKKVKRSDTLIGGNIGKNKDTPNEQAHIDYSICFKKLYSYVDYFVVNLSSPNTPGLRSLQEKGPLRKILTPLVNFKKEQNVKRPILLKISPNLTFEALDDVIEIVQELKIDGIIATNTTIERNQLQAKSEIIKEIGPGGLSGAPLTNRATEIIKAISEKTNGSLPIIGVGGIYSAQTALDKMKAGASLIQIYTGFIYEGPFLVKKIKKKIASSL